MIRKYWKHVTPAVILLMIFGVLLLNKDSLNTTFSTFKDDKMTFAEKVSSAQTSHKEKFPNRNELIDLSGAVQKFMGKRIVGDFEFVKDERGTMQQARTVNQDSMIQFADSVIDLNNSAIASGTPLVYLTLPERTKYFPPVQSGELEFYGSQSKRVGEILNSKGIDCINYEEMLGMESAAPTFDEFYLKTDGHDATQGEYWMSCELVKHLASKYKIEFPNAENMLNLNNYTIYQYDFLGNLARSSGRYFAGIDQFEIYVPKFETDIKCENYITGEIERGPFSEVMLNGYEKGNYTEKTYWITDFGHYPQPYYGYTNEMMPEGAPRLLVICDSTFLSGFTYLTLVCKELTVIDPRYFDVTDYLFSDLAASEYDAIVVAGQGLPPLNVTIALPDIPTKEMISPSEYGRGIADNGICMGVRYDGEKFNYKKRREEFGNAVPVRMDDVNVYLYGWAADFWTNQPFQELYLKVGNALLKCDYGRQDLSLAKVYERDSLLNCGFEIVFPVKYLKDGEVTDVSFYAVSSDGQSLYSPVTYEVVYT